MPFSLFRGLCLLGIVDTVLRLAQYTLCQLTRILVFVGCWHLQEALLHSASPRESEDLHEIVELVDRLRLRRQYEILWWSKYGRDVGKGK